MAGLPPFKGFRREDFPGQEEWIDKLIGPLGQQNNALYGALNRNIAVEENLGGRYYSFDCVIPTETYTTPTLVNAWVNASGYWPAGYRIDQEGRVEVVGHITAGGLASTMFTLPVGYRPPYKQMWSSVSTGSHPIVQVTPEGLVQHVAGTTTVVSLNSIRFLATTPAAVAPWSSAEWPHAFKHAMSRRPGIVVVASVYDKESDNFQSGGASVDWKDLGDGRIAVRRLGGLTPGRSYRVKLLILPE